MNWKRLLRWIFLFALTVRAESFGLDRIDDVLASRYSLYEFKKRRGLVPGRDLSPVADPSPSSVRSPQQKLEYLDRVHQYIAGFRDTHLRMEELKRRPEIFNGLELVLISGRVYIGLIHEEVMSQNRSKFPKSKNDSYRQFEVGDEVLSINGVSVQSHLDSLAKWIPSSSRPYQLKLAAQSISRRRFSYPSSNRFRWGIRKKKTLEKIEVLLPFFVNATELAKHETAQSVLSAAGVLTTPFSAGAVLNRLENDLRNPSWSRFQVRDARVWRTKKGWPLLVQGFLKVKGRDVPYLKLNEFNSTNLTEGESGTKKFKTLEVIVQFLKEVRSKELVLDLRHNGGGSGEFGNQLFEILVRKNGQSYYWTTKYVKSPFYRELYQKSRDRFVKEERRVIDEMFELNRRYSKFSYKIVQGKNIRMDPIVLVGPECISTCDIFSRLIQKSGGKLVGRSTNGTGSGFNSGAFTSIGNQSRVFFEFESQST